MSTEELKKAGQKVAKEVGVNKLFATTDGQFFKEKSFADLHARNNKISVVPLEFEKTEGTKKVDKAPGVKELIPQIEKATTEEEVKTLSEGDGRATVIAAAEKRILEIQEASTDK